MISPTANLGVLMINLLEITRRTDAYGKPRWVAGAATSCDLQIPPCPGRQVGEDVSPTLDVAIRIVELGSGLKQLGVCVDFSEAVIRHEAVTGGLVPEVWFVSADIVAHGR